jgi:hypothetical protein
MTDADFPITKSETIFHIIFIIIVALLFILMIGVMVFKLSNKVKENDIEGEKMKKVYCIGCGYLVYNAWKDDRQCKHPENIYIKNTYLQKEICYINKNDELNKNNDCKLYEERSCYCPGR